MKSKNNQPRIQYSAKIFFRNKGEIKEIREFMATRPALKELIKEVLQSVG